MNTRSMPSTARSLRGCTAVTASARTNSRCRRRQGRRPTSSKGRLPPRRLRRGSHLGIARGRNHLACLSAVPTIGNRMVCAHVQKLLDRRRFAADVAHDGSLANFAGAPMKPIAGARPPLKKPLCMMSVKVGRDLPVCVVEQISKAGGFGAASVKRQARSNDSVAMAIGARILILSLLTPFVRNPALLYENR